MPFTGDVFVRFLRRHAVSCCHGLQFSAHLQPLNKHTEFHAA